MSRVRFEIQRRYFNDYNTSRTFNPETHGTWSAWKAYYELSSSSQLAIIMEGFNKIKETSKVLFEYRIINLHPELTTNGDRQKGLGL